MFVLEQCISKVLSDEKNNSKMSLSIRFQTDINLIIDFSQFHLYSIIKIFKKLYVLFILYYNTDIIHQSQMSF